MITRVLPIKGLLLQSSVVDTESAQKGLSKVWSVDLHALILSGLAVCSVWTQNSPQKIKRTALGTGKGHRGLPIVRPRGTLSMSEVNRVNRGKGEYTERDRQGGRMSLER